MRASSDALRMLGLPEMHDTSCTSRTKRQAVMDNTTIIVTGLL